MEEKPDFKQFNAFIIAGSFSDLSVLDFSIVNVRFFNLENSSEFKTVSDEFKPILEDHYSLYDIVKKDAEKSSDNLKYLHVLIPINFDKHVKDSDYYKCINLLKLIYPSDLAVLTVAKFQFDEQKNIEWIYSYHYHFLSYTEDRYGNFLFFSNDQKQVEIINSFIELYFERIDKARYLQAAMDAYINSFNNMPLHMSYVSLCMALECVSDSTSEIISKISRAVSLICADNLHVAQKIYVNVKKIYGLRSKIVHGSEYKYQSVIEYHPYLRFLISRLIIQLLHTKFNTAVELQNELIFAGFVERDKFFSTDTINLNIKSYAETLSSL